MDDRDLEARLRDRFHSRFDGASPSPELGVSILQAMTIAPRRVTLGARRARRVELGWLLAAAAVIVVLTIADLNIRRYGPGAATPTPPPSTSVQPPNRSFVVMSRSVDGPSKAATDEASNVLAGWIRTLGFGTFSSYAGLGIVFDLPPYGAADDTVRAVLRATGDVSFVTLPVADYGEGKLTATVGKALPKAEPALFERDDMVSVIQSDQNGQPGVDIELSQFAASEFGAYTSAHVGATFAVLIDGVVAMLPSVNAPITSGRITLSSGAGDTSFAITAAILVGGRLPATWSDPQVPAILSADLAAAAGLRVFPGSRAGNEQVDVIEDGGRYRAVWLVSLYGEFPGACALPQPPATQAGDCPSSSSLRVQLDAVTGEFLSSEAPAQ